MKNLYTPQRFVLFIFFSFFLISCSQDDLGDNKSNEITDFNLKENFVEFSQAKEIAKRIYSINNSSSKKQGTKTKKSIDFLKEVKNKKGRTSFYIINYREGGFIILSADKRTQPILAFSQKGRIAKDGPYPPGLQFWLEDAENQIMEIQSSDIELSEMNKIEWEEIESLIVDEPISNTTRIKIEPPPEPDCYEHSETLTTGPLLNSIWEQDQGYNAQLPLIQCNGINVHVLAGCVPIAMGQVMSYYQTPASYNWSDMPGSTATSTTANFIADIHDAIGNEYVNNPIYSCVSTGVSSSANMGTVFKNQFNYSSADWTSYNYLTVKDNLTYGRPVILSGDNGTNGHMWVCDGFKKVTNYHDDCTAEVYYPFFHMNWGWKGSEDGWYLYNNFNPANTNYNNNTKMIYNIIP